MSINPLSADLDIVQSLVIPGLDDDLDIIQKLDDEPNDVGGLTAAELKAKFDAAGNTIKRYINEELLPAISDTVAEADARAAAEAQRQANETARVSAEQGRVTAESGRVSAENVRVSNETARQNAEQGRAAAEQGRVSAEQGRVSAEAARVLAEQQRVDTNTGIVAQATAQANAAGNSAAAASASATAAGNSETAAKTSERNAKASETAAAASASSASTSAQTAASKAGEAFASASSAAQSAQTAQTAAGTAQAAQSAAEASKAGAETARDQAQTACATATTKAGEAQQSASAAVDAAEAISAYGTSVDVVLTAAGWTGAHAPYTQTVAVAGLLADSFGEIGLTQGATDAQRAAARAALLSIQSQADGAVTLIADGDKPTVDLPCTANFGGVVTQDAGSLVPPGGADGQVLGRSGGATVWVDPSGGANPFWVTFTYADGEFSADKTLAEIKAAHDAGDNCIGKVVEGPLTGYAPLSDITAIDATFCFASACMNLTVTADGFVSTGRSYQLPLAGPGALGGVSPETADDAMTQSVGVDEDGRLWTAPGPQGPKGESGVYIGSTEPQDPDVMVWIDPTGGATWETLVNVTTTEDVSMIEYQFGDAYPRLEIITWLPLMSGNVTNNNNLVATINGVSWVNFIQDAASPYGRSTCRSEVVFAFGGVTVLSSSADRCKNIAAVSSAPTWAESIKFNLATSGENDLIRAGTKILIRGARAL
ncbi:hypothetical protein [Intestinimonas butyriciproducens]|uniref:hypothetical protein n=1 Tax=Intestinimonas butyriciproducens TaxID=1297617 RepID=UPI0031B64D49